MTITPKFISQLILAVNNPTPIEPYRYLLKESEQLLDSLHDEESGDEMLKDTGVQILVINLNYNISYKKWLYAYNNLYRLVNLINNYNRVISNANSSMPKKLILLPDPATILN